MNTGDKYRYASVAIAMRRAVAILKLTRTTNKHVAHCRDRIILSLEALKNAQPENAKIINAGANRNLPDYSRNPAHSTDILSHLIFLLIAQGRKCTLVPLHLYKRMIRLNRMNRKCRTGNVGECTSIILYSASPT